MKQRGRKSLSALAVSAESGSAAHFGPLKPPSGLSEAEIGVWQTTVGNKPVEWFGPEHIPLLVEYVRAVCRGHVIDQFIKAMDEPFLATGEGLARLEKLSGMAVKTANMVVRLASAMRLSQQAVVQREKVWNAPKAGARKVWDHARSEH